MAVPSGLLWRVVHDAPGEGSPRAAITLQFQGNQPPTSAELEHFLAAAALQGRLAEERPDLWAPVYDIGDCERHRLHGPGAYYITDRFEITPEDWCASSEPPSGALLTQLVSVLAAASLHLYSRTSRGHGQIRHDLVCIWGDLDGRFLERVALRLSPRPSPHGQVPTLEADARAIGTLLCQVVRKRPHEWDPDPPGPREREWLELGVEQGRRWREICTSLLGADAIEARGLLEALAQPAAPVESASPSAPMEPAAPAVPVDFPAPADPVASAAPEPGILTTTSPLPTAPVPTAPPEAPPSDTGGPSPTHADAGPQDQVAAAHEERPSDDVLGPATEGVLNAGLMGDPDLSVSVEAEPPPEAKPTRDGPSAMAPEPAPAELLSIGPAPPNGPPPPKSRWILVMGVVVVALVGVTFLSKLLQRVPPPPPPDPTYTRDYPPESPKDGDDPKLDAANNSSGSTESTSPLQASEDPPKIDAGADREVLPNSEITLTGTFSGPDMREDSYAFEWTAVPPNPVVITAANTLTTKISTPPKQAEAQVFKFRLTATHLENSNKWFDDITLTIPANRPPTIALLPSEPGTALLNQPIRLRAQATDPDEDKLSYAWEETSGAKGDWKGETTADALFTLTEVPADERLKFELTVNDGVALVKTEIEIEVRQPPPPPKSPEDERTDPVAPTVPAWTKWFSTRPAFDDGTKVPSEDDVDGWLADLHIDANALPPDLGQWLEYTKRLSGIRRYLRSPKPGSESVMEALRGFLETSSLSNQDYAPRLVAIGEKVTAAVDLYDTDWSEAGPGHAKWVRKGTPEDDTLVFEHPEKNEFQLRFRRVKQSYVCTAETPIGLVKEVLDEENMTPDELEKCMPDPDALGVQPWDLELQRSAGQRIRIHDLETLRDWKPGSGWLHRAETSKYDRGTPGAYYKIKPELPTARTPAQRLTPLGATKVADKLGCRLPTINEWQDCVQFVRDLDSENLRDKRWKEEHDRWARHEDDLQTKWTSISAYNDEEQRIRNSDDGWLWFRPVWGEDESPPMQFVDLIGNVREFVTDGQRTAIVGWSAVSPPPPDTAGEFWLVPSNTLERPRDTEALEDVGFRLAFDAPPPLEKRLSALLDDPALAWRGPDDKSDAGR